MRQIHWRSDGVSEPAVQPNPASTSELEPDTTVDNQSSRKIVVASLLIVLLFVALTSTTTLDLLGLQPVPERSMPSLSETFVSASDEVERSESLTTARDLVVVVPTAMTDVPTTQGAGAVSPTSVTQTSAATVTRGRATPTPEMVSPTVAARTATVPSISTSVSTPGTTTSTSVSEIIAVEQALSAGVIDAELSFGHETISTVRVVFDIGASASGPAAHLLTTYTDPLEARGTEIVLIKGRAWERTVDGAWRETTRLASAWEQVQSLLPRLSQAANVEVILGKGQHALHWYDAARENDVVLVVEAGTGIPQRMIRVSGSTGTTLTVVYSEWNVPVLIEAPDG